MALQVDSVTLIKRGTERAHWSAEGVLCCSLDLVLTWACQVIADAQCGCHFSAVDVGKMSTRKRISVLPSWGFSWGLDLVFFCPLKEIAFFSSHSIMNLHPVFSQISHLFSAPFPSIFSQFLWFQCQTFTYWSRSNYIELKLKWKGLNLQYKHCYKLECVWVKYFFMAVRLAV